VVVARQRHGRDSVCTTGLLLEGIDCRAPVRTWRPLTAGKQQSCFLFDIDVAQGSPIAKEALVRITALYRIEASIRGKPPGKRKSVRQELAAALIDDHEVWPDAQLTQIFSTPALAGAIRYGLTHLKQLRPYLHGAASASMTMSLNVA
jgi:hypothetical protein